MLAGSFAVWQSETILARSSRAGKQSIIEGEIGRLPFLPGAVAFYTGEVFSAHLR